MASRVMCPSPFFDARNKGSAITLLATLPDSIAALTAALSATSTPNDASARDVANLVGAYLVDGNKLIGDRPVFVIGPIGSRCDYLTAYLTEKGVRIRAGCFSGDVNTFQAKLEAEHGTNDHAAEYRAALALIEKHAEIWTPKESA